MKWSPIMSCLLYNITRTVTRFLHIPKPECIVDRNRVCLSAYGVKKRKQRDEHDYSSNVFSDSCYSFHRAVETILCQIHTNGGRIISVHFISFLLENIFLRLHGWLSASKWTQINIIGSNPLSRFRARVTQLHLRCLTYLYVNMYITTIDRNGRLIENEKNLNCMQIGSYIYIDNKGNNRIVCTSQKSHISNTLNSQREDVIHHFHFSIIRQ